MGLIFFKVKAGFRNGSSFKYMRNAKIDGVADFRDKLESVWFETLDLASEINEGGFLVKINPNGTETPLDYKDVSILLDRTEKEIEVCFSFFIEQGMIDKLNGKLGITNWEKYQNSTKLELIQEKNRERQRIWYENHKKQAETNPNVRPNVSLTQPNATEVDKEVDEEVEVDKETTPKEVVVDEYDKKDKPAWAKDLCPLTQELIKRKFLTYTDLELFTVDSYLQDRLEERKDNLPLLYAVIHYVVARYNENEVERKGSWFMSGVTHNLACFDYREKTGWDEAVKKYDPKTPEEWEKVLDETIPKMIEAYDNEHK